MRWDPHIDAGDIDEIEYDALLPLYEDALERDPEDLVALQWLGHAYTRLDRYEDGLRIDLKLSELVPEDPVVRYNLGCSYALTGRKDEAFVTLAKAAHLGYRDPEHYRADPDLESLRSDPRFGEMLRALED